MVLEPPAPPAASGALFEMRASWQDALGPTLAAAHLAATGSRPSTAGSRPKTADPYAVSVNKSSRKPPLASGSFVSGDGVGKRLTPAAAAAKVNAAEAAAKREAVRARAAARQAEATRAPRTAPAGGGLQKRLGPAVAAARWPRRRRGRRAAAAVAHAEAVRARAAERKAAEKSMLENATPQREEPVRAWESPPVRLAVDEVEHLGAEPDRMPLEQAAFEPRLKLQRSEKVDKRTRQAVPDEPEAKPASAAALERARAAAARKEATRARLAAAKRARTEATSISRETSPVKLEGSARPASAPAAEETPRRAARSALAAAAASLDASALEAAVGAARGAGLDLDEVRAEVAASGIGESLAAARAEAAAERAEAAAVAAAEREAAEQAAPPPRAPSRGPDGRLRLDVDDLNRGGDMDDVDISMSPNDVELDEFTTREKLPRTEKLDRRRFVPPPLNDPEPVQRFDHRQYEAGYRSPTVELLARERAEAAAAEARAKAEAEVAAEVAEAEELRRRVQEEAAEAAQAAEAAAKRAAEETGAVAKLTPQKPIQKRRPSSGDRLRATVAAAGPPSPSPPPPASPSRIPVPSPSRIPLPSPSKLPPSRLRSATPRRRRRRACPPSRRRRRCQGRGGGLVAALCRGAAGGGFASAHAGQGDGAGARLCRRRSADSRGRSSAAASTAGAGAGRRRRRPRRPRRRRAGAGAGAAAAVPTTHGGCGCSTATHGRGGAAATTTHGGRAVGLRQGGDGLRQAPSQPKVRRQDRRRDPRGTRGGGGEGLAEGARRCRLRRRASHAARRHQALSDPRRLLGRGEAITGEALTREALADSHHLAALVPDEGARARRPAREGGGAAGAAGGRGDSPGGGGDGGGDATARVAPRPHAEQGRGPHAATGSGGGRGLDRRVGAGEGGEEGRRGLPGEEGVAAATRGYCRRGGRRSCSAVARSAVARRHEGVAVGGCVVAGRHAGRRAAGGLRSMDSVAPTTQLRSTPSRLQLLLSGDPAGLAKLRREEREHSAISVDAALRSAAAQPQAAPTEAAPEHAAAEKASLRELVAMEERAAAQAVQAPSAATPDPARRPDPLTVEPLSVLGRGRREFAIPIAPPPGDPESPLPPPPKGKIDRALASLDKARSEARQKATIAAVQKWWLSPGRLFFRSGGACTQLVARFRLGEQKLGLHLNDENVVLFIAEGGLAYAEGTLRVGDKIIEVNGEPTDVASTISRALAASRLLVVDVAFTVSRAKSRVDIEDLAKALAAAEAAPTESVDGRLRKSTSRGLLRGLTRSFSNVGDASKGKSKKRTPFAMNDDQYQEFARRTSGVGEPSRGLTTSVTMPALPPRGAKKPSFIGRLGFFKKKAPFAMDDAQYQEWSRRASGEKLTSATPTWMLAAAADAAAGEGTSLALTEEFEGDQAAQGLERDEATQAFERQALERRASAMRKLAWEKAGRPKPPPGVTPPDARRPSMRDPAWSENPAAHPGYPTLVSERRLSYDAVEGYSEEMAEERLS